MSETINEKTVFVVTFDPREVTGPGALTGLRHMSLTDAKALLIFAWPRHGRIINVDTLEVTK